MASDLTTTLVGCEARRDDFLVLILIQIRWWERKLDLSQRFFSWFSCWFVSVAVVVEGEEDVAYGTSLHVLVCMRSVVTMGESETFDFCKSLSSRLFHGCQMIKVQELRMSNIIIGHQGSPKHWNNAIIPHELDQSVKLDAKFPTPKWHQTILFWRRIRFCSRPSCTV